MALNDFVRIIRDSGGLRIELRGDPSQELPSLTLAPGYVILGGPPADTGSVEAGAMYYDPNDGAIHHNAPLDQI